jgi:hypothetical protein
MPFDHASLPPLLDAKDSREFLKAALELIYAPKRPNLADFSRRAGFASRSYLQEFLTGRKGLSRDGLLRFQQALRLPKPYLQYLELLAGEDFPELKSTRPGAESLTSRKAKIRARAKDHVTMAGAPRARVFSRSGVLRAYAALGSEEGGASLSEVVRRSKLGPAQAAAALAELERENALRKDGDRFYANANALDFLGLKDRQTVASLSADVMRELQRNSAALTESEQNLFFYSALSMRQSKLVTFKAKVREALLEALDQHQDDEGEAVVQVFLGAWN